jgi:polysaccharide export outer membrane protein/exopolysaccharide production protein ExoF
LRRKFPRRQKSESAGGLSLLRQPQWMALSLLGAYLACQPAELVRADVSQPGDGANSGAAVSIPDYRLNVRDKIRVQVFEWRPSRDEVYKWTALNQIYTIDPAGKISLPLIGSVPAMGYTTTELGILISRRLKKRLNLATLPDATIEVTEYRPIFVTGAVERAGEYPYTAGMTVLQGVSLGGGLFKNTSMGGARFERELVTTVGEYEGLRQEHQRLLAHKARLDAELASADRIAFPSQLQSVSNPEAIELTASLMTKEQSIFDLRRKADETQLAALDQLEAFLEKEVETFAKRIAVKQKQIDLMKAELSGIKSLNARGLATQPRLLGLQRNLAELEGEMLRMESDRTRAQQDVSRAKISKIEYQNKRANELTVELQTTEARLQKVAQEASVKKRLLVETREQSAVSPLRLASLGDNAPGKAGEPRIHVHYTIAREIDGHQVEIGATEGTLLQPGDTIKVDFTLPPLGAGDMQVRDLLPPKNGAANASAVSAAKIRRPDRASIEQVSTGLIDR